MHEPHPDASCRAFAPTFPDDVRDDGRNRSDDDRRDQTGSAGDADSARILVVDDSHEMLDVYQKILNPVEHKRLERLASPETSLFGEVKPPTRVRPRRFAVDRVGDRRVAVERMLEARDAGRPYAMAFVDVRTPPSCDGVETAEALWSIDPEMHVVFCTAYADDSWDQMLERLVHPDRFVILRKPFDVTEVRQLTYAFCERWRIRREEQARTRALVERLSEERLANKQALDASARRTQRLLDRMGDSVLVLDRQWRVTSVSAAAEQFLGVRSGELSGKNFWEAIPGSESTQIYQASLESMSTQAPKSVDAYCPRLNRHVNVSICPYDDEVILFLQDAAGAHRNRQTDGADGEPDSMPLGYDGLTGLPDRLSGLRYLNHAAAKALQRGVSLAVALCNLDRFAEINEIAGYTEADELLAQLGRRLQAQFDGNGFIARMSGDEFLVVFEDERVAGMQASLRRLQQEIAAPFATGSMRLEVHASIGMAYRASEADEPDELLRKATIALAQAKSAGGGVVRAYDEESTSDRRDKVQLRHEMKQARATDEFELFYQPQVALCDGRVTGAEALIRWRHPKWGLISPGDFIALAEESSLIARIDAWVIDRACRQLAEWIRSDCLSQEFVLSVNVSARVLCEEGFQAMIAEALDRHGIPARRFELEITETMMMQNLENAVSSLSALKTLGVRVALDDFGVGYSNLDYVDHFPVDKLKIDRTFIRNLGKDAQGLLLVDAIIKLGKSLNLRVVAEGVETEAQKAFLADSGCDLVQGYLTGRPVTADAFERFIGSA
ncbi:EAL domain-containing protein [Burkholderia sp. Ac-20353]|uniref:EAL domain-containing protein n=1 Tax=Burkholderia sp. Ac-20353 TaxID=2703894 RepID=UPI00197BB4EC|nr:EAL domain-containing protein [Burkholderia sp. Ac-20353]MBN3786047.1 EAL domain-containing protein [Burkholderia sp. Ac-20353]